MDSFGKGRGGGKMRQTGKKGWSDRGSDGREEERDKGEDVATGKVNWGKGCKENICKALKMTEEEMCF